MISVVSPFYNEEAILEASVNLMLKNLTALDEDWELIVVNDGSTDGSLDIARRLAARDGRLRVVSYAPNRGRGCAIRMGVSRARGDIVVTTEIDSSWGDDIVSRIAAEFRARPDADIVIASPHMPGGGYRNVPRLRVFLSAFGNRLIRMGLSHAITMNTGMTRGYRREKFLALPLDEDGKEMHLEIVNKALAFGYRIKEIPATLEWKADKLAARPGQKRKSSSKLLGLIRSHTLFSLLAAPFRYMFVVSAGLMLAAVVAFVWACVNLFTGRLSFHLVLTALSLALLAFLISSFGVLAQQARGLQTELWRIRSRLEREERETAAGKQS